MRSTIMIAALAALSSATVSAQILDKSTRYQLRIGNSLLGADGRMGASASLGRRPGSVFLSRKNAAGQDAFETFVQSYAAADLRLFGSELRILDAYAGARFQEAGTQQLLLPWFRITSHVPERREAFAVAKFAGRTMIDERLPRGVSCSRTLANYTLFEKSKTVMAGPVPVLLRAKAFCNATLNISASLPRYDTASVSGTISGGPAASMSGGVGGGAPGIGASAGIVFTGEFGRIGGTATVNASPSGVTGHLDLWRRSFRLLLEAYVRVDYWFDSWERRIELLRDVGPTKSLGRHYLR